MKRDDFIEMRAYRCCYCRELFLTQRHKCRYNPGYRSCYTCEHRRGTCIKNMKIQEDYPFMYDVNDEYVTEKRRFVVCSAGVRDVDIESLRKKRWNLQCKNWSPRTRNAFDSENDD